MRALLFSLCLTCLLVGCTETKPAPTEAAPPASDEGTPAPTEATPATIAEITVADAEVALQAGAVAVDANSESTRKKNGTVPGAVVLTSSYKYDLAQLPDDKSKDLIFYCSNTRCTASDSAAERASDNGYQNVHIMRAGIKGWKDAGKATSEYPQS